MKYTDQQVEQNLTSIAQACHDAFPDRQVGVFVFMSDTEAPTLANTQVASNMPPEVLADKVVGFMHAQKAELIARVADTTFDAGSNQAVQSIAQVTPWLPTQEQLRIAVCVFEQITGDRLPDADGADTELMLSLFKAMTTPAKVSHAH